MINDLIKQIDSYALENKIALKMQDNTISYKKLKCDTDEIAKCINNNLGLFQKPIIIYMTRSVLFIETMIGIVKSGNYYVPLECNIPISRVMDIIIDSRAQNVIVDDNTIKNIDIKACANKINIINIYDLCNGIGANQIVKEIPNAYYQNGYRVLYENQDKLIYVIYTSGSSGIPKGVKIKYSNLQNLVESFYKILYHNIPSYSNVGVVASFSFDSSVKQIYCALYYGHCLCIAEDKDKYFGQRLISFFKNNQIEVSDITPTHLKLLIVQQKYDECHVGTLLIGGEKLRYETLYDLECKMKKIPVLINVYGPTECCVDVAYNYISKDKILTQQVGDVPIGNAINNSKIFLRNDNDEIIEESGVIGELCISGMQVGAGYVNVPNIPFVNGEYGKEYRSGDLAYIDDEGKFVIVGRKDKQIKIYGNRIELDEISSVIESVTGCKCYVECLNQPSKVILAAYLIKKQDFIMSLPKLTQQLQKKLPQYMIPKFYMLADKIPLTVNGKVNEKYIIEELEKQL